MEHYNIMLKAYHRHVKKLKYNYYLIIHMNNINYRIKTILTID